MLKSNQINVHSVNFNWNLCWEIKPDFENVPETYRIVCFEYGVKKFRLCRHNLFIIDFRSANEPHEKHITTITDLQSFRLHFSGVRFWIVRNCIWNDGQLKCANAEFSVSRVAFLGIEAIFNFRARFSIHLRRGLSENFVTF